MSRKHLLLWLFSISVYFVSSVVAREAIIGGHLADRHNEFPYQVLVRFHNHNHNCGAGIINRLHILTAAHCVVNENGKFYNSRISVLAGTDDLKRTGEPTVIVPVNMVFVPTEYTPDFIITTGDIAVLKLNRSLELGRNLKTLKLPKDRNLDYAGETATIAGFGYTWYDDDMEKGGHNDTHLHFAEALVQNHTQCQKAYYDVKISEKIICANVKQRDDSKKRGACNGDSGGPLVVNDGKTVIGILNTSPVGCTEKKLPAIYARVSSYLTFIRRATRNKKKFKYIRKFEPPL